MKKILYVIAVVSMSMASCAQQPKAVGPDAMKSAKDSADYYIGYTIGMQMKQMNMENPDYTNVASGIAAAIEDMEVDPNALNAFMSSYIQNLREVAAEKAKNEEKAYFEKLKGESGVKELSDGIYYKELKAGNGAKPKAEDVVKVNYEGRLTSGKVFDSSYERNEPAEFPLNQVIKGWTIALQNMPVGAKWTIYIPSELGYGAYGAGNEIGPNATLIFDVEMLEINPVKPEAGEGK